VRPRDAADRHDEHEQDEEVDKADNRPIRARALRVHEQRDRERDGEDQHERADELRYVRRGRALFEMCSSR
jgi:hypothetical protein